MDTFWQIVIFAGLFLLMMRFGCGSHLFSKGGHGHTEGHGGCCGKHGQKKADASPSEEAGRLTPPDSQTDPVCGMEVSTGDAKTSFHNGLIYFFCSDKCRTAFEAEPERYVGDGNE